MINNKLSKRLSLVAELVNGRRVVDVGCDHGKVVNFLFMANTIEYAICTDISLPSVKKAEKLLQHNNVSVNKYSIRCGDGLDTVNAIDNIDTAIIAGMGGVEIIKILSKANVAVPTLILQPQRNIIEVKNFVVDNGYSIVYDKIVEEDGKFYTVIKATKTDNITYIDEFNLYFGKDNFEKPDQDFVNYLDYQENKHKELQEKVSDSNRQKVDNMLNLIRKAKQKLGEYNE